MGYSSSGEWELKAYPSFDEAVEYYHTAGLMLVDMPTGFSEGSEERRCDPEAREWLSHKGATGLARADAAGAGVSGGQSR